MSELHIGRWHQRDYGWRADGVVETEDRNIHITARRPHLWVENTDMTYVMANGWTAGKNSMRVPAIEAAKFGHTAITLEYTNTGTAAALERNVDDVAAVLDAQPDDCRRAAMGLSMGGAVVTMALERVQSPVEIADIVAPGKYIKPEFYTPLEVAKRFIAEMTEVAEIARSPLRASILGLTSTANCIRRRWAVAAELNELLTGTVHENLRRVKTQPAAPYVRFLYGLNDRLLPAHAQLESVQGLPFDDIRPFIGHHARLAHNPGLAFEILQLDAAVLNKTHLPDAPLPIAA